MKKLLLLVLSLVVISVAHGQIDVKVIDKYIEQARKDWNVPGMSVAIVKDGQIVLSKGYGVKELGKKEAVDDATQFAIASNTKAFVAAALSRLVVEGKIKWKDKVRDCLPYFALYGEYETAATTIEDLLCHRVGLGTFSGDVIWYKSTRSAEEVIKRVKYVPKAYDFRDGYGYSNLMFITAGEVIKKVTGKPWDVYLADTFFDPLEMNNTITSTNNLLSNYATPHKPTLENGTIPIDWTNWDNMGAAGGIISSAADMANWMMMHLNKGEWNETSFIDPEQLNLMWTPRANFTLSEGSKEAIPGRHFAGYGLGWSMIDYYGNLVVSHGGGYDGMYSRVMMVPDLKLGVVVLTNSMEGIATPLTYWITNQYIQKDMRDWSTEGLTRARADNDHKTKVAERKMQRVPDTTPTKELVQFAGKYTDPMYGDVTISMKGSNLRMDFQDAPELGATLEHWHYNTFLIKWDEEHAWFDFGTVAFNLSNNLKIESLTFDVPNYDIFFEELNLKRVD
jgi:CubicO group peptidase (beta-lactamase class C family)